MTRDLPLDATPDLVSADAADWLARVEVICRLVASRDLAHVPLYIVPQSRLPSVWGTAKHGHAYTTPSLDLYFRDHMRSWRGRGPCMLINDRAVCDDTDPACHDCRLRALVLHELAHILDRPALYEDRSGEACMSRAGLADQHDGAGEPGSTAHNGFGD